MGIGAVVSALSSEFPDISVSKVRFLEAEGLVRPERTGSGYRRYTSGDVERLRYVLRAQRDLFWPLRVIKDALAAADRGLVPTGPDSPPTAPEPRSDLLPDASLVMDPRGPRLTPEELARESNLSLTTLGELASIGVLRPGAAGLYGPNDLQAARAASGLAGHGLEPRHLRTVRVAADREVDLVQQATGALRGGQAARTRAELADLVLELHVALVRGSLAAPE